MFVLLLNCKNSFYHLAYKVCCEYFLPVCGFLFYFVKDVLQRVCKFDEVLIIYQVFHSLFIFVVVVLGIFVNFLVTKSSLLFFSSGNFIVLVFEI